MSDTSAKVDRALARFDRVVAVIDEKRGPVASQAQRERKRLLDRYGRAMLKATSVIFLVSVITIAIGLFVPIGMAGFIAAVGLAGGIAAMIFFHDVIEAATPTVPKDVPNGEMVQRFDSYLYQARRALPSPAQQVTDSISANLGTLKTTLERIDALDPDAQDARRLMSVHLPGLLDRYANVPKAFRGDVDGEGKTVDQRLVEGLDASRVALAEISERLAKRDVDAFQTQGRFIQTRYGAPGGPDAPPTA